MKHAAALKTVKIVHTLAWAVLVGCILGIPWASWRGRHQVAAALAGIVLLEVAVLLINGWRCPLTLIAERYTEDRRDNFDIYLPEWLARHNKTIFGVVYVVGVAYAGLSYWQ
jgi:hypothetical protein